jgi:hypothetical protein
VAIGTILKRLADRPGRSDPPTGEYGKAEEPAGDKGWRRQWDRENADDLQGRARYQTYDAMWIGDPILRSVVTMAPLPLVGADWEAIPASDDPTDMMIAAAVNAHFGIGSQTGSSDGRGLMTQPWETIVGHACTAFQYGSSTAEHVWDDELIDWVAPDGSIVQLRRMLRLAPRWPHAIDPATGYQAPDPKRNINPVVGAVRQYNGDTMPGDKVIHHVVNPAAHEYAGSAVIRPAWFPWRVKYNALNAWGIGFDRFGIGVPVIYHPDNPAAVADAEDIGRGIRSHHEAFVTFPNVHDPATGNRVWEIEMLKTADSITSPVDMLTYLDHQMVDAALAGFTRLGTTESGSRGVGTILAEPYWDSLQSYARMFATNFTTQLAATWVAYNFGRDVAVPRIECSSIRADDVEQTIRAMTMAHDAGIEVNDEETALHVRRLLHLPIPAQDAAQAEGSSPVPAAAKSLPELIQKIYLGVGEVITSEEARAILNQYGANLDLSIDPTTPKA